VQRKLLIHGVKFFSAVIGFAGLFVIFDYLVDAQPSGVQSSFQFNLQNIPVDKPVYLRQNNFSVVIIHRSDKMIGTLKRSGLEYQDSESNASRQPEYAKNELRSRYPEYYVSYAMGTDLGCPLRAVEKQLHETCSNARYDFAGRALEGNNQYPNLPIPDYNFSDDFKTLTVNP
jgi:Rieske Fe-S protein